MERKMDPGWNDPPMLNYTSSNPPPKSRITNKRVAFPLSIPPTTSQAPSSVNTPPIPGLIFNSNPSESGKLDIPVELSNFIKDEEDRKIFLSFWSENKFSSSCKENIELLCKYLKNAESDKVTIIKTKLLLEYKDLCDTWIRSIEG